MRSCEVAIIWHGFFRTGSRPNSNTPCHCGGYVESYQRFHWYCWCTNIQVKMNSNIWSLTNAGRNALLAMNLLMLFGLLVLYQVAARPCELSEMARISNWMVQFLKKKSSTTHLYHRVTVKTLPTQWISPPNCLVPSSSFHAQILTWTLRMSPSMLLLGSVRFNKFSHNTFSMKAKGSSMKE